MSLCDALLLDAAPFEVWIALRSDGQLGSGRIDDPYDGSTVHSSPVQISTIAKTGSDEKDATVATPSAHGYSDGQYVRITGATGADAQYYNGAFFVFAASGTTFKYRMKGKPGANASGTLSSAKIASYRFDDVMRDLPANMTVHIGPGVFETKGFMPSNQYRWQPKNGQKIIGSGMGATTLKLMEATSEIYLTLAVGADYNNFVTSFETSDFTVDCNLPNQSIPEGKHFAPVACAAIAVPGRHIRVRRVRAINFGSQAPASNGIECFVIVIGNSHPNISEPVDCIIEDCVIEQPSENNWYTATCLSIGSSERPTDGVMAYHRACVIRNCYINCEYKNGVSSRYRIIESLTQIGADVRKWRLRTTEPHYRTLDHNITIQSVRKADGLDSAVFNGSFPIDKVYSAYELAFTLLTNPDPNDPPVLGVGFVGTHFQGLGVDGGTAAIAEGNRVFDTFFAGPHHDTWSTKDLITRNNYFHDVYVGLAQLIGSRSLQKTGSVLVYDAANSRAICTSHEDHGLNTNDTVTISDAAVAPPSGSDDWLNNPFNRSNVSITRIDDKRFSYPLLSAPLSNAISTFLYRKTNPANSPWKPGTGLVRILPASTKKAQFFSDVAHGLQAGDGVEVAGAFFYDSSAARYVREAPLNRFNGTFTIDSVPSEPKDHTGSPLSFIYIMADEVTGEPVPSPWFQKGSDPKKCGAVILRNGNTATFSTVLPHGFSLRQAVVIGNARVNDLTNNTFNGDFEVTSVPTPTSFTYAVTNPPTPVTAGGIPDFGARWQVRQFTVEDNVVQLTKLIGPYFPGTVGLWAGDGTGIPNHASPYLYRQASVRGNVIRQPESDVNSHAIFLASIEAGLVENNLVSMARVTPISEQYSADVKYFNNLSTAGDSLAGVDYSTGLRAPELAASIEDALILSVL